MPSFDWVSALALFSPDQTTIQALSNVQKLPQYPIPGHFAGIEKIYLYCDAQWTIDVFRLSDSRHSLNVSDNPYRDTRFIASCIVERRACTMNHGLTFPAGSEGICMNYYGAFSKANARDCVRALKSLEKGSDRVSYTVNQGGDSHSLPINVESGQSDHPSVKARYNTPQANA